MFAAIALVGLLTAVTLALDVGRLYTAQRVLQKQANLAALDASRALSRCDAINGPGFAQVHAEALASLVRNRGEPDLLSAGSLAVGMQGSDGVFRTFEAAQIDQASSVRVQLRRPAPRRLLQWPNSEQRLLQATGFAQQNVIGEISVTGSALSLDSGDSALLNAVLGGLLGGELNLNLLSFSALLDTTVSLASLSASVGVVRIEDLLSLELGLPDAIRFLGDAISGTVDGIDSIAATALDEIAAAADPSRTVSFGDVLGIEPGVEALVGTLPINTAELLNALAQSAARGYPINLPLDVNVPMLATARASLSVGEPPRIAVGRPGYDANGRPLTQAVSSQLDIGLQLGLLNVDLGLVTTGINLALQVQVGQAEAVLERVRCARGDMDFNRHEADVRARSALVRVIAPAQELVAVSVLGIPITIELATSRAVERAAAGSTLLPAFLGPFVPQIQPPVPTDHSAPIGAGNALSSLGSDLATLLAPPGGLKVKIAGTCLPLVCDLLGALAGTVFAVLTPVLALLDVILDGLLGTLGIQAGGGQVVVQAVDVEQPYIYTVGNLDSPP